MLLRRLRRRATVFIWRSPNPIITAVRCAAVLVLFVLPISACLTARHPPQQGAGPVAFIYPSEADASFTDQGRDGGVITIPPPLPLPWQKVKPCAGWEHEIHGACYIRIEEDAMMPPCAAGFIQHKGRCFQAIRKARPEPVSGQE